MPVHARASVAVAALMIIVACGGPTVTPSPSGAPSTTAPTTAATATTAPTTSPASVTPEPSREAPTPGATQEPSPSATPVGALLGTDVLIFVDEFDDPASGWGVGELETARVAYEESALRLEVFGGEGQYVTTGRELGASFSGLRFAALFDVDAGGVGVYGVHCQDEDGNRHGGAVGSDGAYMSYRASAGGAVDLGQRTVDPEIGTGDQVFLMVECAVTPGGDFEMYFSADGTLLLHETVTQSGMGALAAAGVLAFAGDEDEFAFDMIESAAWVGAQASATPEPSPAGDLLAHIPSAYHPFCGPVDASGYEGAQEAVACTPGDDFVSYTQHADAASMDARFDEALAEWAPDAVQDNQCFDGEPGHGDWLMGDAVAGRYVCFVAFGTAFLYWTTDALGIFSVANRDDGDMTKIWQLWAEAGPIEP